MKNKDIIAGELERVTKKQNFLDTAKGTKDQIKLIKAQERLKKTEKEVYEIATQTMPVWTTMGQMMTNMLPLEPVIKIFSDFFGIIGQAFEAGLGDALAQMSETLFSESNIKILTDLGQVFGELVSAAIVPLSEVVSALLPLLKPLIPLIRLFSEGIEMLFNFLRPAIDALAGFTNLIGDWAEATF